VAPADRLLAPRPSLKLLFMSGYRVLEQGVSFLQNPFTPGAPARKVREVLDAGA
jgi:hypothetical protein